MILKGKVLKVNEISEENSERIITIETDEKKQTIDVFTFNKLAFKSGFLYENEEIEFEILLRGLEIEGKRTTQVVAKKIINPVFIITEDHPIVDEKYIRVHPNQMKPGKW